MSHVTSCVLDRSVCSWQNINRSIDVSGKSNKSVSVTPVTPLLWIYSHVNFFWRCDFVGLGTSARALFRLPKELSVLKHLRTVPSVFTHASGVVHVRSDHPGIVLSSNVSRVFHHIWNVNGNAYMALSKDCLLNWHLLRTWQFLCEIFGLLLIDPEKNIVKPKSKHTECVITCVINSIKETLGVG